MVYTRLAQYLGPEAAGQYALLGAYLNVFSMFVDLGMHQLVVKKVSEDQTHSAKYLSAYFSAQFILGFLFMFIMGAIVYLSDYPELVKISLYVTSLGLLLTSLALPFRSVINAHQRLGIIAKVNFYNSVINVVFMILAIALHKNILFLAVVNIAVPLFDILIYGIVAHKNYGPFKFGFDVKFIKQLFIWTFPFTLLTVFSIYNRIDMLLLPHLRSFEETGFYSAAYKFWDILAFFPAVIGISLFPFFANVLSRGQKDQARAGLETYTRYMIAIGLPVAVGAFVLSYQLTLAFYGTEFIAAAPAMWLLVLAAAILFIYSPVNSLIISQQTKSATKVTGFTLLFNLALNIIFLPKYGFVAAAVITVASELIQLICYTYIVKKKVLDFKFMRFFAKPALSAAVMGLGIYFLPDINVWIKVVAGGLIYSVLLFLLKFFKREDWNLFVSAVNIRKEVNPQDL